MSGRPEPSSAQIYVAEIARLLGNQPFIAGDAMSIANVMLAPGDAALD